MIPILGRRGAARLHEQLTLATIRKATAVAPTWIAAQPHVRHGFFVGLRRRGLVVQRQRGADLGQRMRHALKRALRHRQVAIVIGTDCPSLSSDDLRALAAACAAGGSACIPAMDGGYVALAVGADHPALFRQIDWGTPRVLRQTRRGARLAQTRWVELPARPDLDTPTDYFRQRRTGLLPRPF